MPKLESKKIKKIYNLKKKEAKLEKRKKTPVSLGLLSNSEISSSLSSLSNQNSNAK